MFEGANNNFRWRMLPLLLIFCLFFCGNAHSLNLPDQRLHFRRFTIYYAYQDEGSALKITRILQNSLPRFRRIFSFQMRRGAKIVILSSPEEQFKYLQHRLPGWAGAAYFPDNRTIVVKSPRWSGSIFDLQTDVRHELSHLFLHDISGDSTMPVWFDEGLAMMMSGKQVSWWDGISLSNALLSNEILDFSQIENVLQFDEKKARIAYLESQSAVLFLIQRLPEHDLAGFLREARKSGLDATLKAFLGWDSIDFEIKWFRNLTKQYKWYIFFNFTNLIWLFMLFILIIGFILVRRRNRKLIRKWSEIEALQGREVTPPYRWMNGTAGKPDNDEDFNVPS